MRPSDDLIVSATEPTGKDRKKVWMQKGKNLFNPKTDIEATGRIRLYTDGILTDNELFVSVKVQVKPNTDYITSSNIASTNWYNLCFFDSSMTFISGIGYDGTNKNFKTPSNCKYITIALLKTYNWFQLEQGSTATSYEAYIEPEIYVRNDNNVYEKLVKQEKILHTAVFEREFNNVSTQTNVEFDEMFPGLNLNDIICFNVEITNTYSTWDRIYAHVLRSTGTLQVRSYAETQDLLAVRVTAFYK